MNKPHCSLISWYLVFPDLCDIDLTLYVTLQFRTADCLDVMCMLVGTLAAIVHGAGWPVLFLFFGGMTDTFISGLFSSPSLVRTIRSYHGGQSSVTALLGSLVIASILAKFDVTSLSASLSEHRASYQAFCRYVNYRCLHVHNLTNGILCAGPGGNENITLANKTRDEILAEFDSEMTKYALYYVYVGASVFVAGVLQVGNQNSVGFIQ